MSDGPTIDALRRRADGVNLIDVPLEALPRPCVHGRRAMRVAAEDGVPREFVGTLWHFERKQGADAHDVLAPCVV